jgi:F0F1-type ATP synthase membrane subunit b/b'|tara:strand:+ start:1084 stop:1299 length:216 start_codon:yes stop_codon:yes gene_type:complete
MKVPVSFEQFKKNPISAIAFLLVIVVAYLYVDVKSVLTERIDELKIEISTIKNDYEDLQDKYLELIEKLKE